MIDNKERLIIYLNSTVSSVFKILPLHEERNIGVSKHIDSLLFELYSLDKVIDIKYSHEYLSILSTLKSINRELLNFEVFNSVIECMKVNIKDTENEEEKLSDIIINVEISEKLLHSTIKRELFRCINTIKSMLIKLEAGV